MLVSALLGGAGVRAIEMFISWRKENSAATVAEENARLARQKEMSELEAKLRQELRSENEELRKRLVEGGKISETGKHSVVPAEILQLSSPDEPHSVASHLEEVAKLREELELQRSINKSLATSQSLMAQTLVDLRVENERLRQRR